MKNTSRYPLRLCTLALTTALLLPTGAQAAGAPDREALHDEAVGLAVHGQLLDASHVLQRCVRAHPRYAACQRSYGIVLGKLGDVAPAAVALRAYLKLQPGAADAAAIRAVAEEYEVRAHEG